MEFATEENRPAKFPLEEYEVATEDEMQLWNEKIDALLANTKLLSPPNRCSLVHCMSCIDHCETAKEIIRAMPNSDFLVFN